MPNVSRGFTLIELVITVAILGILASIAYPAYTGYVANARTSAAQTFMLDIASAEETYRADALTYTASLGIDGLNLTPPEAAADHYVFALSNVTSTTYTITATPRAGHPGAVLTLDQAGTKSW